MYRVTPNYIVMGGVSVVSILKECEFGLLLLHCSRLGLHCEVRLEACSHVETSDLSRRVCCNPLTMQEQGLSEGTYTLKPRTSKNHHLRNAT